MPCNCPHALSQFRSLLLIDLGFAGVWLPLYLPALVFLFRFELYYNCVSVWPKGSELACPVPVSLREQSRTVNRISSQYAHPVGCHFPSLALHYLTLPPLPPSFLPSSPSLSASRPDRTSLGATEPGLQHQPDHGQPGVEPAGRHGRSQRRDLQDYVPALQLGARGVRSVRGERGILPPAGGISGHLRERGGPAGPRQLHLRGWGSQRGIWPQPHPEAVRRSQHRHQSSK